ncbi:Protein of unknown function (DUF2971) [Spongiibacter sp. IMCC21906]|jgi:hypothetical protein|uniref:DUF2971 domain-containing protein n=1 Tax=Spongiibacter sp. IMCC21906 TaxID=1620392 RepID=UPI00062DE8DA|nr:DUF2971 domain-containing protein [Spongiibacter sp. IMCC21906]AKH70240.1 Protein of unknown function (DUF2971) [Spongiibacter sp. IMCC21906]
MNINCVHFAGEAVNSPLILYKYREVSGYALEGLINSSLYFSDPFSFNDPFEPVKALDKSPFQERIYYQLKNSGILCLSDSSTSVPMWSCYGGALKGFCVGYSTKRLLETTEPDALKRVYKVQYRETPYRSIDSDRLISTEFSEKDPELIKIFATKHVSFERENEYRIVIEPRAAIEPGNPTNGLYSHSPDSLEEIIFGALMPENQIQAVKAIFENRKHIPIFKKIKFGATSYELFTVDL